ncbi:MAG: hypothetical protein FJ112_03315 [Deltaproteobacteria bacterium]|nr:hypothetical protein [Deltaproteobacteria bacterium]
MKSLFQEHSSHKFFMVAILLGTLTSLGDENLIDSNSVEKANESPPQQFSLPIPETDKSKEVLSAPTNTIGFNLRIDGSYSGGGAVSQGFSIPSIRLSGFGTVGKYLDYRLSLGQTKEFSTAGLAQVLPVEAYVVFNVNSMGERESSNLKFKAGLFSPAFNPIWTPDLSYLNLPDFNATHRTLFLSREAGGELTLEAFHRWLEISVGAFNGTGVFAENTNNAKAFTAYARLNIPFQSWNLSLGTGNSIVRQSTEGSVNYKSSWVTDVFFTLDIPNWRTQFAIDGFSSQFDDSVRGLSPKGGSAVINLGFGSWFGVFARYEYSTKAPLLLREIRQLQIGPEIYFDENVKAFVTYTEVKTSGDDDKMITARFRLSL